MMPYGMAQHRQSYLQRGLRGIRVGGRLGQPQVQHRRHDVLDASHQRQACISSSVLGPHRHETSTRTTDALT